MNHPDQGQGATPVSRAAARRWYSIGPAPGGGLVITGWSRDQAHADARPHTRISVRATGRKQAARQAATCLGLHPLAVRWQKNAGVRTN